MAITFVGSSLVNTGDSVVGTTGVAVTPHANTITDDSMIFIGHFDETSITWSVTGSTWIQIDENTTSSQRDRSTSLFYRVATSGSEATATIKNADTQVKDFSGCILTFRGVDTTTPIDVTYDAGLHFHHKNNYADPNTEAHDAITTITDGAWVLLWNSLNNGQVTTNADPSGYTEREFDSATNRNTVQVWTKEVSSAGVETPGAAAFDMSGTTADGSMYTIALRPAAAAGSIVASVIQQHL